MLEKSRRVIGSYVSELQERAVCMVRQGKNQFARTNFEICDDYWPYHREGCPEPEQTGYVATVRDWFLTVGYARRRFTSTDTRAAEEMHERSIPLEVVQDAILLGTCRNYISWLNGAASEPIGSLRYFEPIVAEILEQLSYRDYLRNEKQAARQELERIRKIAETVFWRGVSDMARPEIVQ